MNWESLNSLPDEEFLCYVEALSKSGHFEMERGTSFAADDSESFEEEDAAQTPQPRRKARMSEVDEATKVVGGAFIFVQ